MLPRESSARTDVASAYALTPQSHPKDSATEAVSGEPQVLERLRDYIVRALERNPDIKAAATNQDLKRIKHQIERDRETVELRKLTYWPNFALGLQWISMAPRDAFRPLPNPTTARRPIISQMTEDGTDNWAITFGFSLPIWYDKIKAGIEEASRRLAASRQQYRSRMNRIAFSVGWVKHYSALHHFWPEERPITIAELSYGYEDRGEHIPGLNDVVAFPGLTNAWTMPIKTRIDMLSTGIKIPVGIKIMGDDLAVLGDLAERIASAVCVMDGTLSAYPGKMVRGNYLDFDINRNEIARHGLRIDDVQDVILSAMGGMNITWTVEELERYPVNLRYKRELRDNIPALKRTSVATPSGAQVPLAQLVGIRIHKGPPGIKTENARKTAWIYVELTTSDIGGWIGRAKQIVTEHIVLPTGYNIVWSGQYEYIEAASKRLAVAVPAVFVLILMLLYISHKNWFDVCVVLLAVPFSLIGAIWFMHFAGYYMSLAVWVGPIALAGLDAETGMVMLLYLHNSYDKRKAEGQMNSLADLKEAIHEGAVLRIRPKTMTVMTTMMALIPIMIGTGTGSDVTKRMAAPMFGGLLTSFAMELLIYPVIFLVAKQFEIKRSQRRLKTSL